MRKFLAKHRTFALILLGYIAPVLIIACLFVLSFFFAFVSPETLFSEWFLKITVSSIILCLLWFLLLTLSLIVCVVFDRMGGSARSFGRTLVEGALTFIRDPRGFLAEHRTLRIILLGYLVPLFVTGCLFALYFLFIVLFPPLGEWLGGAGASAITLYIPWLFAWPLFWVLHYLVSRIGSRPREVYEYVAQNKLPSFIFLIILYFLIALCFLLVSLWALGIALRSSP